MNIRSIAWVAALALVSPVLWAQQAGPNDAQIAAIVVTANQVDIDAGQLAKGRAQAPSVKEFAQRMITDHTAVNTSATALVTRLKVTPEGSPTSESLKKGGDQNLAALKKLDGAAFDQAYVDHEVVYHQSVLDALDKTLIPNAKNAELKELLVKTRPAFVDHLQHAKKLQTSLGKSDAAAAH
jgi:putative membrane protein